MTSTLAQYTELSRSLERASNRYAGRLERIRGELKFAHQLCAAHPEQAGEWHKRVLEAGRLVQEGQRASSVDLDVLTAQAEAILLPIGEMAKTYTLMCVSHAHIDMNWMWSWPETVAVTNDTFQTMFALMDEFPAFIYSQSQASTYELIERYNPPMFETIRQRIAEGRWEVTASQWVEGDKNMASGESISRHLLYTREYLQDRFGLSPEDVEVDFEPDTFGHPATLPSILARGGVKYYYHCRGSQGPHLYRWVGPDGSRLLVFNDVVWYMCAIGPQIADPLVEYALSTGTRHLPVLYGVGDHGGGPTRRDLRRISELNTWPIYPNVECSSLHGFFRTVDAEATALPEVVGERNFVFTGCYTSQAWQKQANRHGENLLYAAEAAATVGSRVADVAYPHHNLDAAWKHLLFDQFHDILPGSGTRDTRNYALGRAQDSQAAAGMARSNALRALCARVNTASLRSELVADAERAGKDEAESGRSLGAGVGFATGTGGESAFSVSQTSDRAFLVFNPLPYARTEVIEVKLWDTELDPAQLVAIPAGTSPSGDAGAPCPVQVLDDGRYWGHTYRTVAFPVEVPALGYRTVCVSDRLAELGLWNETVEDPWAGMQGAMRRIPPPNTTLENEVLAVRLDPASGGIVRLFDKRTGREWVPEGGVTGTLQYCVEANQGMTAWVIGQFLTREDLLDGGELVKVHDGPHVNTFRWTRSVSHSKVELDTTLRRGASRVEYRLRVDWREMGSKEAGTPHLKVRFPLAVCDPQPRYEIPFGSIRRDLTDGQEVPALRWADLSEAGGAGVTLVNSSKYGFSVEGSTLNMTLLRASIDPDPLPDLGEHIIEYALVPHGDGWAVGQSTQAGEEMNEPLVPLSCGFQEGDLPGAMSFVQVEAQNVRLAAIKESQDGQAVILRLIEVEGVATEARVTLSPSLLGGGATAVEVDTLERPLDGGTARLEGQTLTVALPAFGIATVCIGA